MAEGFKLTPEKLVTAVGAEIDHLHISYRTDKEVPENKRWRAWFPNIGWSGIEGTGGNVNEAVSNLAAAWVNNRRQRAADALRDAHHAEKNADQLVDMLRRAE